MRVVAHIIVKLITEIISACVFPTSLREMSENYRNRWIGHDKNPIQSTRIASLLLVTGADQFDRACIAAARTLRCVDLSWVVRPKQRFVLTLSEMGFWKYGAMPLRAFLICAQDNMGELLLRYAAARVAEPGSRAAMLSRWKWEAETSKERSQLATSMRELPAETTG